MAYAILQKEQINVANDSGLKRKDVIDQLAKGISEQWLRSNHTYFGVND